MVTFATATMAEMSVERFEAEEAVRTADNNLYYAEKAGKPDSVIEAKRRDVRDSRQALKMVIELGR